VASRKKSRREIDRVLGRMQEMARRGDRGQWSRPRAQSLLRAVSTAAAEGDAKAQYGLARLYLTGQLGRSATKRSRRLLESAASAGHESAQNDLAVLRQMAPMLPGDQAAAFRWFLGKARQGSAAAEYSVGRAYFVGAGTRKSYRKSRLWFSRSARKGHVFAQAMLAEIFRLGLGTSRDVEKAGEWYRRAAAGGDAESQYYWGMFLLDQARTERERRIGARWLRRAAKLGDQRAQAALERETALRTRGSRVVRKRPSKGQHRRHP
jgi:uncharacterized protein